MSSLAAPRRLPPLVPLLGAAVGIGAVAAVLLGAASGKVVAAVTGAAVVIGITVLSKRRREVLLGLAIALIPIDVKTYQDVHNHAGGAPGLVVTVQMVLLVPLVAMAIMEAAGSRGARRGGLPRGAVALPLLPLLLALPSFFHSQVPVLSWYELLRMAVYLALYLYVALTFRPSDLPLYFAAFMAGILLELPFAGLQFVKPGTQIVIGGQDSTSVLESVGADSSLGRVSGTLSHPNFLGGYLSLVLPIAVVGALARGTPTWARRLAWAALLGGGLMLLLTFSRGSWIGLAVALPVVLVTMALRGMIRPSRAAFLLIAGAVAGMVLVALPPVWERLFESDPANVSFRFDISNVAIAMWHSQPFTGVGLNTFVENSTAFDYDRSALQGLPVHNVYLLWLAETGVVGLVGISLFFLWTLIRAWAATRTPRHLGAVLAIGVLGGLIAMYVGETVSFSTRIDSVMQAMAVLMGVVVALRRKEPSRLAS